MQKLKKLPAVEVEGKNNNQLGMKASQEFLEAERGISPLQPASFPMPVEDMSQGFSSRFWLAPMGHSTIPQPIKCYKAWRPKTQILKFIKAVIANQAKFSDAPWG